MVTQLQDVANTVAQEKISNQRLRNEEIRRQMANPWSEPKEPTTSGRQPLQDVTKGTPTLASTYSGLLSNYQGMTGTSSNSGRTEGVYNQNTTGQTSSGNTTFGSPGITGRMPGWGPTVVGTGLSLAGAGIAAPIGAASMSLMRGDRAGAASILGSLFTNVATKGSIPGLGGVVGTVASGITKGKDFGEIAEDAAWSVGKSALTKAIPGLGVADLLLGLGTAGYSALTGKDYDWNPRRGLEGLFFPDTTQPASWQGGFFDPGYRQQEGSYITSGNENYSPYGGSQYNRVGDSSSSSSNSSSSSGYPSSGSWSSYSSGSAYSSDSDSESSDGGW